MAFQCPANSPFDCLLLDLDDTLYPGGTGIGPALKRNIDEFLMARFGLAADGAASLRVDLFRSHGSTLAGLICAGPRRAPGRVPQLRARAAALRQDRRRPAPRRAAAEHPAAQDPVHELGPRAHGEGAGAAGRRRGLLRRRRLLRDHEPAPLRRGQRRRRHRHRPHRRGPQTVRRRHRRRPARRRHEPTPNALPRRQREEHRRGESPRPPHSPGWQEGEEQGGGLRAGEHRRPPASHPGDLGRRRRRRRAAAGPQRREEQEHEGRPGRHHPAHVNPGLILINRVLISNDSAVIQYVHNASLIKPPCICNHVNYVLIP